LRERRGKTGAEEGPALLGGLAGLMLASEKCTGDEDEMNEMNEMDG
jgi:hypothetical protein